jgi:hypothetical protein
MPCPDCGHVLNNGSGCQTKNAVVPPEARGWNIEPTSPDLLAWVRQTLNEHEIVAELEEVRRRGGVELKDFIHELEAGVPPGE